MIQVAVLWLIDGKGNALLAQRAYHKAQDPGVWGPAVTGKLEPGETFDQALTREVEEELSLNPANYTPHFLLELTFDHPDKQQRKFGIYYAIFSKDKTSLIHIDPNEVEGIDWFPIETIKEKMMKSAPEGLVPSAGAIWPSTFEALHKVQVI